LSAADAVHIARAEIVQDVSYILFPHARGMGAKNPQNRPETREPQLIKISSWHHGGMPVTLNVLRLSVRRLCQLRRGTYGAR
jgi:hypothetical protein